MLYIDDNVECVLEESAFNDVKAVKSIEVEYDVEKAPKIRTTLGLNKVNPSIQLFKAFEEQRKISKEKQTVMKETALYNNGELYYWEE